MTILADKTTTYRVDGTLQPYARTISTMAYLNYNEACVEERKQITHNPWSERYATDRAREEGIILIEDHWATIRLLQRQLLRPNVKRLHQILEDRFKDKGGLGYLNSIFPSDPVTQGCRFAGVTPPWS